MTKARDLANLATTAAAIDIEAVKVEDVMDSKYQLTESSN